MNNKLIMKRNAFFGLPVLLILLSGFIIPQCRAEAQSSTKAEKALSEARIRVLQNRRDPIDFTLSLLNGGNAALSSYKGKVVILNFWATWCPPCRSEMPSMEVLYRRFKDQGLEILAVDIGEESAVVDEFIRNNRYTFPVLLDKDIKVSSQYGVSAIPTTFIVDRQGKIVGMVTGSIHWDDSKVIAAFEALLES